MPHASRLLGRTQGRSPEDAPATADPLIVGYEARNPDGATPFPPVGTDGDAIRGTASLNGIIYQAIIDRVGLRSADVLLENAAAPAAMAGLGVVGRGNAALLALGEGDAAILSMDLSSRLRVVDALAALGNSFTPSEALAASVTLVAAVAGLRFVGFAVQEAGAPAAVARINIRHGTLDSDPLIVPVNLSANQGTSDYFGPDGILAPNGIRIEVVSGDVDISVYHKTVT